MTTEQYSNNIKECIRELQSEVPNLILSFGQSLVNVVKERIYLEGEGKEGKFPNYTPKYDAYKTKKNKNQGFRDLNFSGSLMKGFKVYKEGKAYEIGFPSDSNEEIAEGNSKWAGVDNVIEPKEEEVNIQIDILNEELITILKKYL
jgi:hypothetical protein